MLPKVPINRYKYYSIAYRAGTFSTTAGTPTTLYEYVREKGLVQNTCTIIIYFSMHLYKTIVLCNLFIVLKELLNCVIKFYVR